MGTSKRKILVTGGLGFIGSHTVVELIQAGYEPIIVDNLVNSELFIQQQISIITGVTPVCYFFDVQDKKKLSDVFLEHADIELIIHFAAHKAVGESNINPLKYFSNNLISLIHLLEVMNEHNCKRIVFSSSATVYGDPESLPVNETASFKQALSAYGSTKQMSEEILEKMALADQVSVVALRYFNPVGAHPSGLIGELPKGTPNNLMPYISQAAKGKLKKLIVFGDDYETIDGTCVRDYIHVVDLAKAHVSASRRLTDDLLSDPFEVFNIGTGKGLSVLEVITAFENVNTVKVPYSIGDRRMGDVPINYADVKRANDLLKWESTFDIHDMVRDVWNWEKQLEKIHK